MNALPFMVPHAHHGATNKPPNVVWIASRSTHAQAEKDYERPR